jgi:predicted metal-dependent phosphoesterase TrpH
MYLLDLHVHFKRRERHTEHLAEAQVEAAVAKGLDGIAFTEHHQFLPADELTRLRDKYPEFKIYSGVEVTCGEDWLVYGLHDERLCQRWTDYIELWHFVQRHGGAICLAHPFRRRDTLRFASTRATNPHGMESRSTNTPVRAYKKIMKTASDWDCLVLQNSDAHKPRHVGAWFNCWDFLPDSDRALAHLIVHRRLP